MDRERHARVCDLFERAAPLDAARRSELLDAECADDAGLRREVESLLVIADRTIGAAHPFASEQIGERRREMEDAMDRGVGTGTGATSHEPPSGDRSDESVALAPGTIVGRFRIERVLGMGGMGTVYAATQDRPSRTVALKLIRPGFATPKMLRRFEVESEILGRLSHPGIAQVYDAGVAETAHGTQPYFAMELIEGVPLTRYAAEKDLGTRERLELIARVADAVEHAHQKGVIHRDLKPGNILVDASGQPKVLDFGVARATDADIHTTTMQTDVGALIGTIPYMSPEQAGGDPSALDTRSDVYALGVVAYQLLAGRLPYDLKEKMIHEAVRVIREEEPSRLSTLNRTLRGDVETIVGKALEKEPGRRYQSAADLGEDIRHYLHDEPISARPPSAVYQLRKFSRRNKALVGGFLAVLVVLLAGIVVSTVFGVRAERARAQIADALHRATAAETDSSRRATELEEVAAFQSSQLAEIDPRAMGERMRAEIVNLRRKAIGAGEEGEVRAGLAELDAALEGVSFTSVALDALDQSIFERALRAIDADFADQPVVQARLLQSVAKALRNLGLYDRAMPPQERALEIFRAELGPDAALTIGSTGHMSAILAAQGRYDEAEVYLDQVLESIRRTKGDDHPSALGAADDMANLRYRQGRYAEAEELEREVMERRRRTLGENHADTLKSITMMAILTNVLGRYDEAEAYFREAIGISRRVLGDDHPQTLSSIYNMGTLLYSKGRYEEAAATYREALEGFRRAYGDNHPNTVGASRAVGTALSAGGKPSEAEPYVREALEAQRRLLGDDHPTTLNSIGSLGFLLMNMDRLDEAEPLFREALDGKRRTLGDDHPTTIASLSNMGSLLMRRGKLVESEQFMREALERRRSLLGDEHPSTLLSVNSLGAVLDKAGKFEEARDLLLASEPAARRLYTGSDAARLGEFLRDLGWAQAGLLEFDAGERTLLEAHGILVAACGPDDQRTRACVERIVTLYDAWHEAEPGDDHAAQAARWRAELPPTDSPETPGPEVGG